MHGRKQANSFLGFGLVFHKQHIIIFVPVKLAAMQVSSDGISHFLGDFATIFSNSSNN